jgi:ribonuclease HI
MMNFAAFSFSFQAISLFIDFVYFQGVTRDCFPTRPLSKNTFFTDGSLCEELAGAGVFSEESGTTLHFSLGQGITVFQAEVFAIIKCVEHCMQLQFPLEEITICSDSQAAIQALICCKIDSGLVLECKEKLNQLADYKSVTLIWVPGTFQGHGRCIPFDLHLSKTCTKKT